MAVHVVHLICSRFFGGPERQILGLSTSLPGDYRCSLVVFSEDGHCVGMRREAQRRGIECHVLADDCGNTFRLPAELQRLLVALDADILCCHGYKANLIGNLAARSLNLPSLVVLRGWTGENFKVKMYELIDRVLLGEKSLVVCLANTQVRAVRQSGVVDAKIRLIPNAINLERFPTTPAGRRESASKDAGRPAGLICCSAGRLSPEKGFIDFIYAAKELHRKQLPIRFNLFGEGPLRPLLHEAIAKEGLEGCVSLPGFCTEFDRVLETCDILVIPSYTEGLPNVLLEAFAAGVPVVATAVGGIPDLVEDGHNGFLVRPGDVSAMAEKIELLANDASLRRAFARNGRNLVKQQYSFQLQAERYHSVFRELLHSPAS